MNDSHNMWISFRGPATGKPTTWPTAAAYSQPNDWMARWPLIKTGAPCPPPGIAGCADTGIQMEQHR